MINYYLYTTRMISNNIDIVLLGIININTTVLQYDSLLINAVEKRAQDCQDRYIYQICPVYTIEGAMSRLLFSFYDQKLILTPTTCFFFLLRWQGMDLKFAFYGWKYESLRARLK